MVGLSDVGEGAPVVGAEAMVVVVAATVVVAAAVVAPELVPLPAAAVVAWVEAERVPLEFHATFTFWGVPPSTVHTPLASKV